MNKITLFFGLLALLLSSCGNNNDNNISNNIDTTDKVTIIKNVYYSLPSAIEMAILIKKYSPTFNPDSLHDLESSTQYLSTEALALNLGIYSADLAFISIYEQNNLAGQYLDAIQKLSQNLGIIEGFDDSLVVELKENFTNPAKLKDLLSKLFFKSDAFLKENEKGDIAAQIIVGSWVESFYILSNSLTDKNKDDGIYGLFFDQKLILENVRKIASGVLRKEFMTDLDEMQIMLDNCVISKQESEYDPISDSMITKTSYEFKYTKEDIEKIRKKIIKIRKIFVSLH